MSIKLKLIKIFDYFLLVTKNIFKKTKFFIDRVVFELYHLKQKPIIKKIFSIYANYIDLVIRRSCAFVFDALIIFSILIVVEAAIGLLLLYSDNGYSINIGFLNSNTTLYFHKYFHWFIYFSVVGYSLSRMHGSTVGYRIFNIKLLSPNKSILSVVGSILRSLLPFFIPFIYFALVFLPYLFKAIPDGSPQLELIILISLILIWPISIVFSKGAVSIYDLLLSTKIVRKDHSVIQIESSSRIYIAILSTIAFSVIATAMIHNSEFIARASIIGEKSKEDYYPSLINEYSTISALLEERIFKHENGDSMESGIVINRVGTFDSGDEDECEMNGVKWKIVVFPKVINEKTQQWLVNTIQSSLKELNRNLEDYEIITQKFIQVNIVNMSTINNYRFDKDWDGYILMDEHKYVGVSTMF